MRDDDLDLLLDDEDLPAASGHQEEEDEFEELTPKASSSNEDDLFIDDDDDDENPTANKGQDAVKVAEVEEDDDEDDEVVKPALSPVILGVVAATVLAVGGGAGYVMLKKTSQPEENPIVNTSMPAPSISELGNDLSIPSTNLVDENADKPLGDALSSVKEKATVDANQTAVSQSAPPVQVSAEQKIEDSKSLTEKTLEVAKDESVVSIDKSQSKSVVDEQSPVSNDSVSKEDIKKLVADAVKDVVVSSKNEDLQEEVDALRKQLESAKAAPTTDEALSSYKAKVIEEIRNNKAKREAAKAEADKIAVSKAIDGKKRLPGFQVVNATSDGQISIIKAPSGRTFALFKGEKFRANNGSLVEVKEIVAKGKLVVAGDNWYIDDVVEAVQKSAPVKTSVSSAQSSPANKKTEVKQPPKSSGSLNGWAFHASFEGGGYLVKTPSGEYKTVKKGESEDGLGNIYGVDEAGNLKTEKGLVKGAFN